MADWAGDDHAHSDDQSINNSTVTDADRVPTNDDIDNVHNELVTSDTKAAPASDEAVSARHTDELEESDAEEENKEGRRKSYSRAELQRMLADALIYRLPHHDLSIIVRSGADVNGPVTHALRPIHYAAFDNNCDGLRFLLQSNCRINVHDNVGFTAVHLCAKHGHYDSLKLLLENGAYPSFVGDFGPRDERQAWSEVCAEPLSLALEHGHVHCASLLLQYGARVDNHYPLGSEINLVPLENLDCLALLLENKADPNALSRVGDSPLMAACKEQNLNAAQMLIQYGSHVNQKSLARYEEKTSLYYCILTGNCEILGLLLENGADVHAPISRNNNALTFAVSRDKYIMCELLLAFGANVNERNTDGLTPLLAACTVTDLQHQYELVRLLLHNGAHTNAHHHIMRYYTPSLAPIHEYFVFNRAENLREEIPKLLIKYGARVTFRLAHSQSVIKDPFSVLNHVRKLDPYAEIYDLLLSATEAIDPVIVRQCDLMPVNRRIQLLDLASSAFTLKHLTRLYLRRHLGTILPNKVALLPLPNLLKSYLLFYL